MNFKTFVKKNNLGNLEKKAAFKNITTMKVGGKIKYLFYPNSIDNLRLGLGYIKKNRLKYFFIGNGSNVIASDKYFDGIVISGKYLPQTINTDKSIINVSAFYDLRKLVNYTVGRNIDTFTKLAGIPATLGGALFMNASANNCSIYDELISITYLENFEVKIKLREEIDFDYRKTEFMKSDSIILEAKFNVVKKDNILSEYHELLKKRKESQPILFPNSGSIFKNFNNKKAYEVIKDINLAGYKKGNAQISHKHSNFIINTGNAKAKDIYNIIQKAKKKAKKYNRELKEEVILLNFK